MRRFNGRRRRSAPGAGAAGPWGRDSIDSREVRGLTWPRMKTLLIEDNRGDVTLFQVALKSLAGPVEVFVADDGVKAMEFLRREGMHLRAPRPDFVVPDLKLPRRSGLEVLSDIKRDPDLRRIPVVVLTSSKASGDVARAYDLQATAYFVKPVTGFDVVVEAIVRFMKSAELPTNGAQGPGAGKPTAGQPSSVYPVLPTSEGRFEEWPLEKKLSAIVESSVDPIISLAPDGRITTWNHAAEELYGYTAQEAAGENIRMIVPEEGGADLELILAAVRQGQRVGHPDTG